MPQTADLPDYEPMLAAYHRAFAPELEAMIGVLPIRAGDRVVEMACGDGAYTPLLANRVGADGLVIAVDISKVYLQTARAVAVRSPFAARIAHVAAPIERLPLPAGEFDLIWCAQSLYSLPDQVEAIRTMAGLSRPGGTVAVLENDTIHQIVLPWPVEVELAVRQAELDAFEDETDAPRKFYVGRRLVSLFQEAGLSQIVARSFAANRQAPLGAPERAFLGAYLAEIRDRVAARLDGEILATFLGLVDPESAAGLLNRIDTTITILDHVVSGIKAMP